MPRTSPYPVVLAVEEKRQLQQMVRKYTLPYFKVVRAKIILLAAEGMSNTAIAEYLHVPREVVSRWRKRFFEQRLAGLDDLPRSGRPPVFSPSGDGGGEGVGV